MMHGVNRASLPTALTALTIAGLTLAGCSSPSSATQAATAPTQTAAAAATPAPTSTVMTEEEAGRRYLELAKGRNEAGARAAKLIPTGGSAAAITNLKAAKAAAGDMADACKEQLDGLADPEVWPANVRKLVEQIAEDRASELVHLRAASKATTAQQLVTAWNAGTPAHPEATALIRAILGLPEA